MGLHDLIDKKNIVLYGLGTETERTLIEWDGKYNVIGLLDGFKTEGEQFGYPIVDIKNVVKQNDGMTSKISFRTAVWISIASANSSSPSVTSISSPSMLMISPVVLNEGGTGLEYVPSSNLNLAFSGFSTSSASTYSGTSTNF